MGAIASLVSPGEIPVYIQPASLSVALLQEPAHFNRPKPTRLLRLSDDHWASLKLRVDPLARKILDPHRSMMVAGFLILLLWEVFRAIRPNLNALEERYEGLDDDYYRNNGENGERDQNPDGENNQMKMNSKDYEEYINSKEQQLTEYMYHRSEMEHALIYWNIGFCTLAFILVCITAHISKGMMDRNTYYDEELQNVTQEIRHRFQSEGYDICYRTNQRDTTSRNENDSDMSEKYPILNSIRNILWRPQRVIVFTDLIGDSGTKSDSSLNARTVAYYSPTNSSVTYDVPPSMIT